MGGEGCCPRGKEGRGKEVRHCGRRKETNGLDGGKAGNERKRAQGSDGVKRVYISKEHGQIEEAMLPHDSIRQVSILCLNGRRMLRHLREDNKVPDLQS